MIRIISMTTIIHDFFWHSYSNLKTVVQLLTKSIFPIEAINSPPPHPNINEHFVVVLMKWK